MKPRSPSTAGKGRFPQTEYFFHSGFGQWRGHFWSSDGEDRSRFRNLFNLGREYRIEAARERAREMAAFAGIVLTSAWPVVYMIVTVVKLLRKGRPLNLSYRCASGYCRGLGQRNSSRYSGDCSGAKPWRLVFSVTRRGTRKCRR